MKKKKFTKLSLGKSSVANFNKVFGGGWNQGPTYTATQGACEDQTASCLCGDPISKGGVCTLECVTLDENDPVCISIIYCL